MSLITGLGGVFLFSDKPKELADWFIKQFGFEFSASPDETAFYQMFITLDKEDPSNKIDFHFSIMKANRSFKKDVQIESESMYGDQNYMLNIRTENLTELINYLEKNNVMIIKKEDYDYGKFAWIRDPEGNRIELYQPL